MYFFNALSLAPNVNNWLANSHQPRILHLFDQACNLINEHKEVLSIVTPHIGNGPFNLVIEGNFLFSEHITTDSIILIAANQLTLGNIAIDITNTKLWSPYPDWKMLHSKRDEILNQLLSLPRPSVTGLRGTAGQGGLNGYRVSNSLISSLAVADLPSSISASQKLAGLGIGLTPAGDDFILGAVLAAWIIHPPDIASILAKEVSNAAVPLTTSLSAAWLRSAGRGEAGILWHQFFDSLVSASGKKVEDAMYRILSIGETSGADALAGFISAMIAWMKKARS